MLVTEDGIVTNANELHLQKVLLSMLVIGGRSTLVKQVHSSNARSPIATTEGGMSTLFNDLHLAKALSPMVVTDAGMVTLVNKIHPANARPEMVVTDDGMMTLVTVSLRIAQDSPQVPTVMAAVPGGMVNTVDILVQRDWD